MGYLVRRALLSSGLLAVGLTLVMTVNLFSNSAEAAATTITVTQNTDGMSDDGMCTLREAITAANTDTASGTTPGECAAGSGADTIVFSVQSPAFFTILLEGNQEDGNVTGDFDIVNSVTLQGTGADDIIIDANFRDRAFDIHSGTVSFQNLTIRNGRTPDVEDKGINAEAGGGIRATASSSLTLNGVALYGNATAQGGIAPFSNGSTAGDGGNGGGLYTNGSAIIINSEIYSNTTGNGGSTLPMLFDAQQGGEGGGGGGIYATGSLTFSDSEVHGNRAGSGGTTTELMARKPMGGGSGGNGGGGGGIVANGGLGLINSRVYNNAAGTGGADEVSGNGGRGGGVVASGTVSIEGSSIHENDAGDGPSDIIAGDGGHGGGLYFIDATSAISATAIYSNTAGAGGKSAGDLSGNGGNGGGLYSDIDSTLFIRNSVLYGNTGGRGGGNGLLEWVGRDGDGGGLYSAQNGVAFIENSTISSNTLLTVGSGNPGGEGGGVAGNFVEIRNSTIAYNRAVNYIGGGGGGVAVGTLYLESSIIANNETRTGPNPDCQGAITSRGYNLIETVSAGCEITGDTATNITGQDPQLNPLVDNGGDTLTHLLRPGSPALDTGSCVHVITDQRDEPRPVDITSLPNADDGCDIGAYEEQNSALPTATVTPNGGPTFTATPTPEATFTPTATPTPSATGTASPTPEAPPSVTPTGTATVSPTVTTTPVTATPSATVTTTPSTPAPATPSPTATPQNRQLYLPLTQRA